MSAWLSHPGACTTCVEHVRLILASLACSPTTLRPSSITTADIMRGSREFTSVRNMNRRCAWRCRSGPTTWSGSLRDHQWRDFPGSLLAHTNGLSGNPLFPDLTRLRLLVVGREVPSAW